MKEIYLKIESVNSDLKEKLIMKDGKAHVEDEEHLELIDALLIELIDTKSIIDLATGNKKIDWKEVKECIVQS